MIKALVKRYVRQWLFERALYLSDEDLNRLSGGNPLTLAYVRKVYQLSASVWSRLLKNGRRSRLV